MHGDPVYNLVRKLKSLKTHIKRWTRAACPGIQKALEELKVRLDAVQNELGVIGLDYKLAEEERKLLKEYRVLKLRESIEIQ